MGEFRDRIADLQTDGFSKRDIVQAAAEIGAEADASIAKLELEALRLKTKINGMLEILSDELPKAMRKRVGARFNAELENQS